MDLLDMFISGAVIAAVFIGAPKLWKLGKQKQAEAISNGKVYYGLLYCRVLLFYLVGVISGELILMILLGMNLLRLLVLVKVRMSFFYILHFLEIYLKLLV